MKAVFFESKGKAEEVLAFSKEIMPEKPKENEVTVKVAASAINPADFMFIEDTYRIKPSFPQIAGFEGVGRILDSNKNFKFHEGQLVGFRFKNVWAEYVNIPVEKLISLPDSFPLEKGAKISLNPITAWSLLEESQANSGDWIVLTAGGSSVSQLIVQFAKQKGINVISLVRGRNQMQILEKIGTDITLDTEHPDFISLFQSTIENKSVVSVLDAVGGSLISEIVKIITPGCRIIHYGLLSKESVAYHNADVIFKNLQIKGFGIDKWMSGKTRAELSLAWNNIITIVSSDDFYMPVSGKYGLEDFKSAVANSKSTKNGKTLFWME